jgi:hypothetical protein
MRLHVLAFTFVVLLVGLANSQCTETDPQSVYILEQKRLKQLIQQSITNQVNLGLSNCGQKNLSKTQKMDLLKNQYLDIQNMSLVGPAKNYLKLALEESGPDGVRFVANVDFLFSERNFDLVAPVLSEFSDQLAVHAVQNLYYSIYGTDSRGAKSYEALAIQFISEPADMLGLMSMTGFDRQMPLLMAHIQYQLKNLKAENLNASLVCQLYRKGQQSIEQFEFNNPEPDHQVFLREILTSVMANLQVKRFDQETCNGESIELVRKKLIKSYDAAVSKHGLNPRSTNTNKKIVLLPNGYLGQECNLTEIRKSIDDAVETKFKWPNSYFGGLNLSPTCGIYLDLVSVSLHSSKFSSEKKRSYQKGVNVRLELRHPSVGAIEEFTTSISSLKYLIYSKILGWNAFPK